MIRRLFGTSVVLFLLSCGEERPHQESVDGSIVAVFDGGEITVTELDRFILSRSHSERRLPGRDLADWYEKLAKNLAFQDLMRHQAEASGLATEPNFLHAEEVARRGVVAEVCVAQKYGLEITQPTEDEIREAYENFAEQAVQEERRLVFNIFIRKQDGVTDEGLYRRLEEIRDRAMGGESFARLAAQYSDSETRHQEGLMGWIDPGLLAPDLESVVFALEEGVPSEPFVTPEGGHIYFVDEIRPRQEYGYEEARDGLRSRLIQMRRQNAVADWEDSLELPVGSVVPTKNQLFEILRRGDSNETVFRIGDQEVNLGAFRSQLRQAEAIQQAEGRSQRKSPEEIAWQVLKQMERRELIHSQCQSDGGADQAAIDSAIASWRSMALAAGILQKRVVEHMEDNEERLSNFYDANPGRFSTQPRWQIRRLTVPFQGGGNARMAILEEDVLALNEGSAELEDIATKLDGKIDDLGWRTLPELATYNARMARLVSALQAGECSPPVSLEHSVIIFQAVGRQEPTARSFETARVDVLNQYLVQHREDIMDELLAETLDDANFKSFPAHLEAMRDAAGPGRQARDRELVQEVIEMLEELEQQEGSPASG